MPIAAIDAGLVVQGLDPIWTEKPETAARVRGRIEAVLDAATVPGFLAALRARQGMAARALEFAVLTAARTGEVPGARWSEIDWTAKVWSVPAERMKAGREHRVPLSNAALRCLKEKIQ